MANQYRYRRIDRWAGIWVHVVYFVRIGSSYNTVTADLVNCVKQPYAEVYGKWKMIGSTGQCKVLRNDGTVTSQCTQRKDGAVSHQETRTCDEACQCTDEKVVSQLEGMILVFLPALATIVHTHPPPPVIPKRLKVNLRHQSFTVNKHSPNQVTNDSVM